MDLFETAVMTALGEAAEASRGTIPPELPLLPPVPLLVPPPELLLALVLVTVKEMVLAAPAVPVPPVLEYGVTVTLWLPTVRPKGASLPLLSPEIDQGLPLSTRFLLL